MRPSPSCSPQPGKGREDVSLEMVPEPGFPGHRPDSFHPMKGTKALRQDHRGLAVGRQSFPEERVPPEGRTEQEPRANHLVIPENWAQWDDMRAPEEMPPWRAGAPTGGSNSVPS